MRVGIDYPWFDYGWELWPCAAGVAGQWNGPWLYNEIDGHLELFHDLGLGVVRWFILADGTDIWEWRRGATA